MTLEKLPPPEEICELLLSRTVEIMQSGYLWLEVTDLDFTMSNKPLAVRFSH